MTDAFDAFADKTTATENIKYLSLPSQNINTFAWLQAPVALEKDLILASFLPAFTINPHLLVSRRLSRRASYGSRDNENLFFLLNIIMV